MMRILEKKYWNNKVLLKSQTLFNHLIAYYMFLYTTASISLQCLFLYLYNILKIETTKSS